MATTRLTARATTWRVCRENITSSWIWSFHGHCIGYAFFYYSLRMIEWVIDRKKKSARERERETNETEQRTRSEKKRKKRTSESNDFLIISDRKKDEKKKKARRNSILSRRRRELFGHDDRRMILFSLAFKFSRLNCILSSRIDKTYFAYHREKKNNPQDYLVGY